MPRFRTILALLSVGIAGLLPVPAGASPTDPKLSAPRDLALSIDSYGDANQRDIIVHVATSFPHVGCTGKAHQAGQRAPLGNLKTGKMAGRQWHWLAGDSTPRSTLTVDVTCHLPDGALAVDTVRKRIGAGPRQERRYTSLMQPGSLRDEAWTPVKADAAGIGQGGAPVYPRGRSTAYVARRRPDLPAFVGAGEDAADWAVAAKRSGFEVGTYPQVGAIAVFHRGQFGTGEFGHVAYVIAIDGNTMTVAEANYRARPAGSLRRLPWAGLRFIYKKQPTTIPPATQTQIANGSGAGSAPTAPPPVDAAAATTAYQQTAGVLVRTWTDYRFAGGVEGPSVAQGQKIEVSCKVPGFRVADGNTWWYRIASAPWNGVYYVSADAFYNNGATSGGLNGTPFVDPRVGDCPAEGGRSVSATRGPAYAGGYALNISVRNFPPGTYFYSCHDDGGPGGTDATFYSGQLTVSSPDQSQWPGVLCYDSSPFRAYIVIDGVTSNTVQF
jgi:surface antigen